MLTVSVSIMMIVVFIICILLGSIAIDVYEIIKLINCETDVDIVEFKKCVLPYEG